MNNINTVNLQTSICISVTDSWNVNNQCSPASNLRLLSSISNVFALMTSQFISLSSYLIGSKQYSATSNISFYQEFNIETSRPLKSKINEHLNSEVHPSSLLHVSLDELAYQQGVLPAYNLDSISALWPVDDDPDELLKYILTERSNRRMHANKDLDQ